MSVQPSIPSSAAAAQTLLRRLAAPMTIALFAVVASTGVLMLSGAPKRLCLATHEWSGCAFVVAACLHVMRNAEPFWRVVTQRRSLLIIAAIAAIASVSAASSL